MDYLIEQDIENIMELTDASMETYAEALGVSRITMNNWIHQNSVISGKHMNHVYEYAYRNGIRLNKIKEQFYREDCIHPGEKLLFHGAKSEIIGELSLDFSKQLNDFGSGFYCGDNLEQSVMFVSGYNQSSLYMLKFIPEGLKCKEYCVSREWMLTVAYYRGRLTEYENTELLYKLKHELDGVDYVIAPIADNRMYEILDSFIDGEITDAQCQHCLSATNLGMQYVFLSKKALSQISILERCYLTELEKEDYLRIREESYNMNIDKVKLARKQYRNQGYYIEDILK